MKDGAEMAVISGFRIYDDRSATQIDKAGDAPPHTLTFAVWEPAEPTPEEEIIEEEEEEENEGETETTPEGEDQEEVVDDGEQGGEQVDQEDQGEEEEQEEEQEEEEEDDIETTTFEEAVDRAQVTSLGFDSETQLCKLIQTDGYICKLLPFYSSS